MAETDNTLQMATFAAGCFWGAEGYHQRYFAKHGITHCRI